MNRIEADKLRDMNWSEFVGSLPLDGVVRPRGVAKTQAAARVRKAFDHQKMPEAAS